MLDSGVPDIALEPDKTVQKIVPHILFTSFLAYLSSFLSFPPPPLSLSLKVKDKFRLEMSEEQAVQYLQNLSIKAVFPELFERIHKLAMVCDKGTVCVGPCEIYMYV